MSRKSTGSTSTSAGGGSSNGAQSVKVFCRIRPSNKTEVASGGVVCVKYTDEMIEVKSEEAGEHKFNFDRILGMDSTQPEVFSIIAQPLIKDILQGYNATILAYGQSGTGKTHTMEGDIESDELKGIIPRSIDALFDSVAQADENMEFIFKVSYVEIYLEKIRDLLDQHRLKTNLTIREDKLKGIYIAGVTEEYVGSVDETLNVMHVGATNRAVAATGLNAGSSRSHSVFTITVVQKDTITSATKSGKLVLVDLAGSEMVRKSNATGQQLEEAKMINKSLSALGMVINALTDNKKDHVPYRDSKLTRILQDSLGGNSKTALMIAVSPSTFNSAETVSTLRFGTRAKSIENKVTVNQTRSVEELQALLSRAEAAIDAQSAYIITLSTQLQGLAAVSANSTAGISSSVEEDETSLTARLLNEDKIIVSKSLYENEQSLILRLQESIQKLQEELDEEKQETTRKDVETKQMAVLLREKERIATESSTKLAEVQRTADAIKERSEATLREKLEVVGELEQLKASMHDDFAKVKFQLSEMEAHTSMLDTENKQLRHEIASMTGDMDTSSTVTASTKSAVSNANIRRPVSLDIVDDDNASIASSVPYKGTRQQQTKANNNIIHNNTRVSMSSSSGSLHQQQQQQHHYHNINSSTHDDPERLLSESQRKDLIDDVSTNFLALCSEHNIDDDVTTILYEVLDGYSEEVEKGFRSLEEKHSQIDKLKAKKLRDVDEQRQRLEKDLQNRMENLIQLQMKYDHVSRLHPAQAEDSLAERDAAHLKSLQQRLEQLVAVHRQLLRKYAHLELETLELKKKVQLRDERIDQLEGNSRGLISNIRQQAERHVAELTALREQIQRMQADHEYRVEALKIQSQLNSGGSSRIVGGKRPTLRGGGGMPGGGVKDGSGAMNDLSEGLSSSSMKDDQQGYDPYQSSYSGGGAATSNKYPSFSPAPRASTSATNYPDFLPAQPITNSASLRNVNNNSNSNSDVSSIASSKGSNGNSMFSKFMRNNK